jgi:DNA polymerase
MVGEAPGAKEDALGLPFVGRAGSILDRLLEVASVTRSEVFLTNVVKCRPVTDANRRKNRHPKPGEVAACRPFLEEQLAIVRPTMLVTVGEFATNEILGTSLPISRARQHVWACGDRVVVPTFHPAVAIYRHNDGWKDLVKDFELVAAVLAGGAAPDSPTSSPC